MDFTNDLSGAENTANIGNDDTFKDLMPKALDHGSSESLTKYGIVSFPDDLFRRIPTLFFEVTENLQYAIDKNATLHSLLIVASGLLPNVYFKQKGRRCYLNLMGYHIAPPGSGKGALGLARRIADKVQQRFKDEAQTKHEVYRLALAQWRAQKPKDRGPEPQAPTLPCLIMPDDTTKAKLFENLMASEGHGIVLGSEVDTTSSANKGEHGSFSDVFRKAAEHEPISKGTKQEGNLEVTTPKLTVALTSTPGQLPRLMQDGLEDGLLSRFIYLFWGNDIDNLFLNQNTATKPGLAAALETCSMVFYDAFYKLHGLQDGVELIFTAAQQEACHQWAEDYHRSQKAIMPELATGSAKRAPVMLYRIAGILEMVERMSTGQDYTTGPITCTDAAFALAKDIMDTYKGNALKVIEYLVQVKGGSKPAKEIERAKVIALCEQGKSGAEIARLLGISTAKVSRIKAKYTEGLNTHGGADGTETDTGHEQD